MNKEAYMDFWLTFQGFILAFSGLQQNIPQGISYILGITIYYIVQIAGYGNICQIKYLTRKKKNYRKKTVNVIYLW